MNQTISYASRKRVRRYFGRLKESVEMPNLIEIQKSSYEQFLQREVEHEVRLDKGIQAVFNSIFPVKDFSDRANLEFVNYSFDKPKYDVEECRQRGMTYSAPLRVTLRLIVWDVDETSGSRSIRDIKEQDVFMGDMPLMTDKGTFVINGTERVIVSQMHRSPGVFFDHDKGKTHASGKLLFAARIIPYRGSWLDIEFDSKDLINVRIDRRRKLPVTSLLRALALDTEEIFSIFYEKIKYSHKKKESYRTEFRPKNMRGKALYDVVDAKTGKTLVQAGERITARTLKKLQEEGLEEMLVPNSTLMGKFIADDIFDENTGEIFAEAGDEIDENSLNILIEKKIKDFYILDTEGKKGSNIRDTLSADSALSREEALFSIYRVMRPGEPPTEESAERLFYGLFLATVKFKSEVVKGRVKPDKKSDIILSESKDVLESEGAWLLEEIEGWKLIGISASVRQGSVPAVWVKEDQVEVMRSERYDLSDVGRVKMNSRLDKNISDEKRELVREDIISVIQTLIALKEGRGEVDDIDHLGNRRVRSVGELMENQYRLGLLRMERSVRERMSSVEIEKLMPHDLINSKPAVAVVREFFGSSQLSQFMDQTNPLSEITHKRRLSALGPGGLTRERAGFEVRDVHPTHYGRICPVETPEGPNIGLINSLATYALVNKYGFIESPYRKVVNGKVTEDVVYLSAMQEVRHTIAQANAPLNTDGSFQRDLVSCRRNADFITSSPDSIDYMDVSPKQLISVASALIPFLENDDANRALMGSNMQRQAVPLVQAEAPLVGTGMEEVVARDSGATLVAKRAGIVDQIDARRIVVRVTADETGEKILGVDIYNLLKFQRSNQNTSINQRPLVKVGDYVKANDVIADGPCTDTGELALGRNVLVAFMPWNGYNFEDSILISERIVRDDVFTSIHIEEFEIMARDTKLGPEEITRDIPNVGEEALRNLDEAGIVYIGAEVNPNDILVGKVTPKGESPMTPEEKLLRAIFGEKAADVRDTSLKLPPGVSGTVVEVRVFSRRGVDKDERALSIEREDIDRLAEDRDDERRIIEQNIYQRLKLLLLGRQVKSGPKGIAPETKINEKVLEDLDVTDWWKIITKNQSVMDEIEALKKECDSDIKRLQERFSEKIEKIQSGDELLPAVMKMVKVFVAVKRKLQPGDKMAGRHGNKGVISKIAPIEDMPHLEDGTPVDIVLNPLGVPSRMNVGQILETHLGWAAAGFGKQVHELLKSIQDQNEWKDKFNSTLENIYGKDLYKEKFSKLSMAESELLAKNLTKGVPMATPVFDGAREKDIVTMLEKAGCDPSGQVTLIDGRTGEPFSRPVTVGYIYMLKLHHLVEDKIHARSTGPYSLVTQQPLGGKAQLGGQRFGEMEVWALEAYGASYTLQEILTVKSDDVAGRVKVYETIVKGDENFESGIPESFNVLVKEIKSLALNVELN